MCLLAYVIDPWAMNFDTVNDRKKGDKEKEKGMEGAGNRNEGK